MMDKRFRVSLHVEVSETTDRSVVHRHDLAGKVFEFESLESAKKFFAKMRDIMDNETP